MLKGPVDRDLSRWTISGREEGAEKEVCGRKLEEWVDKQSAFECAAVRQAQPALSCSECTASTGSLVEI